MEFEWDERKSEANLRKHGVAFPQAVSVLEADESAITVFDEASSDEDRYTTVGSDALGRLLVVFYTVRGERVRIISARRANKLENARSTSNERYEAALRFQ